MSNQSPVNKIEMKIAICKRVIACQTKSIQFVFGNAYFIMQIVHDCPLPY